MRLLGLMLASVLVLAATVQADARERRRGERKPTVAERYEQESRRSSTVDRQGLCQRDNGRPLDSLNLNHQCDREEFWARFNDRGSNRH